MRLANREHEAGGWRIAEIAPDFRLEDAWALPAYGGAHDFPALIEVMGSLNTSDAASRPTRTLFRVRRRVGAALGWDDPSRPLSIPDGTEVTLLARLPDDLRGTTSAEDRGPTKFTPLYRTDVEWAGELSNGTVHAVMQLAWVERGGERYQGRMGVYVKPRGRLGACYMAAIAPFRHWVVYPALMRQIERAWNTRDA
jgi:Protein of unknown function (DUF2867)